MQNWQHAQAIIDARAHVFNSGRWAGNAGLGIRSTIHDCDLLGVHAYYDFRSYHHLFEQQISGGLEYLSHYFDVRIDGYLPFGKKGCIYDQKFVRFQNSQIMVDQKLVAAIPLAELELGVPVKSGIYLAAGPYYLFSQDVKGYKIGDAWGGKVRLSWDIGNYLTLEGSTTYDPIFDFGATGFIRLNFPLGKKFQEKKCNYSRRNYPIVRNEIIPILHTQKIAPLNRRGEVSEPLTIIFVNNTAEPEGNGSFESPFASLKQAEAFSEPGDIIYVFPGDHTPKNMEEGIVLKEDQILVSSGHEFSIEEVTIPALTPNDLPVITNNTPEEKIVEPANQHLLSDFFRFINEITRSN